jgi:hypothetical protein
MEYILQEKPIVIKCKYTESTISDDYSDGDDFHLPTCQCCYKMKYRIKCCNVTIYEFIENNEESCKYFTPFLKLINNEWFVIYCKEKRRMNGIVVDVKKVNLSTYINLFPEVNNKYLCEIINQYVGFEKLTDKIKLNGHLLKLSPCKNILVFTSRGYYGDKLGIDYYSLNTFALLDTPFIQIALKNPKFKSNGDIVCKLTEKFIPILNKWAFPNGAIYSHLLTDNRFYKNNTKIIDFITNDKNILVNYHKIKDNYYSNDITKITDINDQYQDYWKQKRDDNNCNGNHDNSDNSDEEYDSDISIDSTIDFDLYEKRVVDQYTFKYDRETDSLISTHYVNKEFYDIFPYATSFENNYDSQLIDEHNCYIDWF